MFFYWDSIQNVSIQGLSKINVFVKGRNWKLTNFEPDTRPRFIPAAHFSGARAGYIFKAGQPGPAVRPGHPSFVPAGSGTGYYLDASVGASELSETRACHAFDMAFEAALRASEACL